MNWKGEENKYSLKEIRHLGELPIAPQSLVRVLEFIQKDSDSLQDLAQIILKDQMLTMMTLKAANSVHYSTGRAITTVSQAVILMGTKNLANIFQSLSRFDFVSRMSEDSFFDLKRYWHSSLLTAKVSRTLAEALRLGLPEEAYVAGLLHDLGCLVLHETWPEAYSHALMESAGRTDPLNAEKAIFGFTHQDAGVQFGNLWNLKDPLLKTVGDHHRQGKSLSQKSGSGIVDLVHVAALLTRAHLEDRTVDKEIFAPARQLLGLAREEVERIRDTVSRDSQAVSGYLQISDRDLSTYARILEKTNSRLEHVIQVHERVHGDQSVKLAKLTLQRDACLSFLHCRSRQEVVEAFLGIAMEHFSLETACFYEADWDRHLLSPSGRRMGNGTPKVETDLLKEKGILVRAVVEKRPLRVTHADGEAFPYCVAFAEQTWISGRDSLALPLIPSVLADGVVLLVVESGSLLQDEDYLSLCELSEHAALRMRTIPSTDGATRQRVSERSKEEKGQNYFREVNKIITDTTYLVNDGLKVILKNVRNIQGRMDRLRPDAPGAGEPYSVNLARREITGETSLIDEQLTRISESLGRLRLFSEQIKHNQLYFVDSDE